MDMQLGLHAPCSEVYWTDFANQTTVTIQSSTPVADDPISQHLMLLLKVHN